jgi:hypothetical protein
VTPPAAMMTSDAERTYTHVSTHYVVVSLSFEVIILVRVGEIDGAVFMVWCS